MLLPPRCPQGYLGQEALGNGLDATGAGPGGSLKRPGVAVLGNPKLQAFNERIFRPRHCLGDGVRYGLLGDGDGVNDRRRC